MSAFAHGFIAFHIEVGVETGACAAVKGQIKDWRQAFRQAGAWPGFPGTLVDRLEAIAGVNTVVCEGPQSSLLIPLRMIRGMTGASCTFQTLLGTGAVSQAIEQHLRQWGIDTTGAAQLGDVDAPIEFSIRDVAGGHESLRIYPASRKRYQARLNPPREVPDQFFCNRFNKGIMALASNVSQNGGLVSFRPRELGRYDSIDDYILLLASSHHLILSSRHGVMKQLANAAGLEMPRGWPKSTTDLSGPLAEALANWALGKMADGAIVALVRHPENAVVFYRQGYPLVAVSPPPGYGPESRAARIQGALAGQIVQNGHSAEEAVWQSACHAIVTAAFEGTASRPWSY